MDLCLETNPVRRTKAFLPFLLVHIAMTIISRHCSYLNLNRRHFWPRRAKKSQRHFGFLQRLSQQRRSNGCFNNLSKKPTVWVFRERSRIISLFVSRCTSTCRSGSYVQLVVNYLFNSDNKTGSKNTFKTSWFYVSVRRAENCSWMPKFFLLDPFTLHRSDAIASFKFGFWMIGI